MPRPVCRMTSASGSTERNGGARDFQRMGKMEGRTGLYDVWFGNAKTRAMRLRERKETFCISGRTGGLKPAPTKATESPAQRGVDGGRGGGAFWRRGGAGR